MEVAYTRTLEDYVAYNLYIYQKARMPRMGFQVALATVFLFIGSFGLAINLVRAQDSSLIVTSVLLLGFATFPITYPKFLAHFFRAYAKKLGTQGLTGPVRLILTDESLTAITETCRTEARWCGMLGTEVIDGYTFIRLTGVSALILPRAGFASDDDYFRTKDFAMARAGKK